MEIHIQYPIKPVLLGYENKSSSLYANDKYMNSVIIS